MRHLVAFMASATILAISGPAGAEGFDLTPGNYQFSGTMKMPMMPNGMPVNNTQCITEADTNMSAEELAQQMAAGGDCSISNLKMGSGTMNFGFTCQDSEMGTINGTYAIAYTASSYTINGDVSTQGGPMPMKMQMEGTATRVGDC